MIWVAIGFLVPVVLAALAFALFIASEVRENVGRARRIEAMRRAEVIRRLEVECEIGDPAAPWEIAMARRARHGEAE